MKARLSSLWKKEESNVNIGVLCVQGAFLEHEKMLEKLGADYTELRKKTDIKNLDGIILPGGESTVQGKLLRELDMFDEIKELISNGIPTLATCAGLILLASSLSNDSNAYFQTLPVTVKRNAYGRQLGSFKTVAPLKGIGEIPMTFIRAPYIEEAAKPVDILATVDEKIVAVRYKSQIGLSFHPELDEDSRLHQYFLNMIR